jgi:hypothetical protein
MRGRREERIEAAVDHLAAIMLAAAAGYVLFELLGSQLALRQSIAVTATGSGLIYLMVSRRLRAIQPQRPRFEFPVFRMADLELAEPDELLLTEQVALVLTEADRLQPLPVAPSDELVLDDILAELAPDARVVRLFDPASVETPGQLQSRIDDFLHGESPGSPPADASKALYDALAELRRSLR